MCGSNRYFTSVQMKGRRKGEEATLVYWDALHLPLLIHTEIKTSNTQTTNQRIEINNTLWRQAEQRSIWVQDSYDDDGGADNSVDVDLVRW